jgi:uncharacterized membrane protein (UPF0127 family)
MLCLFALGVPFISCARQQFANADIVIERAGGVSIALKVELARTPEQRSQGLMHRKRLPDGKGMLFMFERDEALSFWMKNTYIPLSIAFIASDGRITEIKDMEPLNLNSVKSSRSVRYALEVPQGWFGRAGIQAGDRLIIGKEI